MQLFYSQTLHSMLTKPIAEPRQQTQAVPALAPAPISEEHVPQHPAVAPPAAAIFPIQEVFHVQNGKVFGIVYEGEISPEVLESWKSSFASVSLVVITSPSSTVNRTNVIFVP